MARTRILALVFTFAVCGATLGLVPETVTAAENDDPGATVYYRTMEIDGLDIFYREAGDPSKPTVLLLHGFPTSSHMFRNLMPALADEFHLLAPDYPGYGNSSMPTVDEFDYTFDHLADIVETFVMRLGVERYSLYLMDYGAPVGFRLALRYPERVQALIIQNGNAYDEGLDNDFWEPIQAYWKDRGAVNHGLDNDFWEERQGGLQPAQYVERRCTAIPRDAGCDAVAVHERRRLSGPLRGLAPLQAGSTTSRDARGSKQISRRRESRTGCTFSIQGTVHNRRSRSHSGWARFPATGPPCVTDLKERERHECRVEAGFKGSSQHVLAGVRVAVR